MPLSAFTNEVAADFTFVTYVALSVIDPDSSRTSTMFRLVQDPAKSTFAAGARTVNAVVLALPTGFELQSLELYGRTATSVAPGTPRAVKRTRRLTVSPLLSPVSLATSTHCEVPSWVTRIRSSVSLLERVIVTLASINAPGATPSLTTVVESFSGDRNVTLSTVPPTETATIVSATATIAMTAPTERRRRQLAPTVPFLPHARMSNLSCLVSPPALSSPRSGDRAVSRHTPRAHQTV